MLQDFAELLGGPPGCYHREDYVPGGRAGRWVTVVTDVPYYLGAEEMPLPYQAPAATRDPVLVTLGAGCILAFIGYVAAAMFGWPLSVQEFFGVAVVVLLAVTVVAWFVRAPVT